MTTPGGAAAQGLRDLDQVREFMTGNGLIALCDAPWVPIFILGCFMLHPWYGYIALGGAAVLFGFALLNDFLTRSHLSEGARSMIGANHYVQTTLRNAEVTRAMGMLGALRKRWKLQHDEVLGWQAKASDRSGSIMGLTKFFRMMLQISILGTGAYLVVHHNLSAGSMIAASIMMSRALAPVEQSVGNWRSLVSARSSYERLNNLLKLIPPDEKRMPLPTPAGELTVERLFAAPPGVESPMLKNISFQARPGEAIGILGHSGAGKSTLARVLVGVWPYNDGAVRLDGTEMPHWNPDELGAHVGYLPQDVELFSGTIAENISRFSDNMDHAKVIEASRMGGVHDLIQKLPKGYNTQIGEGGQALSGGQRQRIGLARAVYGNPPFIVLDEPNSNLDTNGEIALVEAIKRLRDAGKTIILITHKANILAAVDKILVINEGLMQLFGPRDEVLARLANPRVVPLQSVTSPGEAAPAVAKA